MSTTEWSNRLSTLLNNLISYMPDDEKNTWSAANNGLCSVTLTHKDKKVNFKFGLDKDDIINLMLFHTYAIETINLLHNPGMIEDTAQTMSKRSDKLDIKCNEVNETLLTTAANNAGVQLNFNDPERNPNPPMSAGGRNRRKKL